MLCSKCKRAEACLGFKSCLRCKVLRYRAEWRKLHPPSCDKVVMLFTGAGFQPTIVRWWPMPPWESESLAQCTDLTGCVLGDGVWEPLPPLAPRKIALDKAVDKFNDALAIVELVAEEELVVEEELVLDEELVVEEELFIAGDEVIGHAPLQG